MAASRLENVCFEARVLKCPLQDRFVEVVPPLLPGHRVRIMARSWKGPLPPSLFACIGVFPLKGSGRVRLV